MNELLHESELNSLSIEKNSVGQMRKEASIALLWCKEYQALQTAPLSERLKGVSTSFSTKLLKIIETNDDFCEENFLPREIFSAIGTVRAAYQFLKFGLNRSFDFVSASVTKNQQVAGHVAESSH